METKVCCSCGQAPRRSPDQKYCLPCHAAYMRKHRPKHRDLAPEARRKAVVRAMAGVYLRRGKLVKCACEGCGSPNSQMHHPDYSQPLQVTWLCRECHLELHRACA